jgi:N utilization substance protein B
MPRRRRARQVALQLLYQDDLNPGGDPPDRDALVRRRLRSPELAEFARTLLAGVRRHRAELDRAIERTAVNWSLDRMPATDRNVLRLGAYEILFADTPDRVAIDEAIELAKRFGTAQSAAFVNGILDCLMHGTQNEAGPRQEAAAGSGPAEARDEQGP